MAPTFRRAATETPPAESPERLFDNLPRTRSGRVAQLWSHQADILRDYHQNHESTPDVALELPTGAGKTVPGLLIAEWRRTAKKHRVLYAAPTVQLARQTADAAAAIGLNVVTLTGTHHAWPSADKLAYERGAAVGVTTYSTVFNTVPALEPAQTLLFDDAHAGEQYVAGSWSISIGRRAKDGLYLDTLAILAGAMSGVRYQELREKDGPVRRPAQVIGVTEMQALAPKLAAHFRALEKDTDQYWSHESIGDRLDRCLAS